MIKIKKAFTIIEVLIVVVIVSILAGLSIMVINPGVQMAKARDTNRKRDVSLISEALGQYYADNNRYHVEAPGNLVEDALTGAIPGTPVYMASFPTPVDSFCYTTPLSDLNPQSFVLCTFLEVQDPQVPTGVTSCNPDGAGSFTNRYCVTNPF